MDKLGTLSIHEAVEVEEEQCYGMAGTGVDITATAFLLQLQHIASRSTTSMLDLFRFSISDYKCWWRIGAISNA